MKTRQTIVFLIIAALLCAAGFAVAEEKGPFDGFADGFDFMINMDGTAYVTNFTTYPGSGTDIVIPETLDGYTITGVLGANWSESITSITFPGSVTFIGENSFGQRGSLVSIVLSEGLTDIGDYAFEMCSGLTDVVIPGTVTTIGERAFYGCTSLASLTLPASVLTIGEEAFAECETLTTIRVYPGSYAETWAQENGFTVAYIEN